MDYRFYIYLVYIMKLLPDLSKSAPEKKSKNEKHYNVIFSRWIWILNEIYEHAL